MIQSAEIIENFSTRDFEEQNKYKQKYKKFEAKNLFVKAFYGKIYELLDMLMKMSENFAVSAGKDSIHTANLSGSIDVLSKKLENQSNTAENISNTTLNIMKSVSKVSSNANEASKFVEKTTKESKQSQNDLQNVIANMQDINEATLQTSDKISALNDKAKDIKNVTEVIDDIADQTNLLALNAAIEAARAGKHGRGFAVVAEEVRSLAEKTTKATQEVDISISRIQDETSGITLDIKQLSQKIDFGVKNLNDVASQLNSLLDETKHIENQINQIANNASSNNADLEIISSSIDGFSKELNEATTEMKTISNASHELVFSTESSHELVSKIGLDKYHETIYIQADDCARDIGKLFENLILSGEISEQDLFDKNYQKISGTNPQKYSTRYDKICDTKLPAIQEEVLRKNKNIVYAIATDPKGYVPTHNNKFAQALTGDYKKDFTGNRSKRIFSDRTGARCGSHTQKLLLQTYLRDTGEIMHDMSIPIYVNAKHWGGLRVGYLPE